MFNLLNPFYLYMSPDDNGAGGGSGDPAINEDNSQGGDTSQQIDWSKVDPNSIPETVLKNNKAYTKVLDEAVTRRQTIKSLRDQLSENKPQDQGNANKPDQPQTSDAISQQLKTLSDTVQGLVTLAQTQQTQSLIEFRKQAAEAYGIKSDSIRDRLQGNDMTSIFADAEKVAKELGIQPPPVQNGSRIGNVNGQRDKSVLARVEARIKGNDNAVDPYSPDLHSALGGGIFDPYEE